MRADLVFAGHIGVGLTVARAERSINVGVFIAAALFLDVVLWVLVLLGIESVAIPEDFARTHQPHFVFPYSHGLVHAVLWSVLFAAVIVLGLGRARLARGRTAALLAATVFSHWLLDALVHRSELPLTGPGSRELGLGLWSSLGPALAVETALVVVGLIAFLSGSGLSCGKTIGLIALCVALAVFTIVGMTVAPPPPSSAAMAASSLMTIALTCVLLGWLGRRAS